MSLTRPSPIFRESPFVPAPSDSLIPLLAGFFLISLLFPRLRRGFSRKSARTRARGCCNDQPVPVRRGPNASILGTGSCVPSQVITNNDVSTFLDTSHEWINRRTGIVDRHVADQSSGTAQLGAQAVLRACNLADVDPAELDCILLCTSTPDNLFGSASEIQALCGATNAVAFDLTAACSGFMFGLVTADQFLSSGKFKKVAVVGSEVLSRYTNWEDRGTAILFGDAAGAVILGADPDSDSNFLIDSILRTDGTQSHKLHLMRKKESQTLPTGQELGTGAYGFIEMQGQEVYKFAVSKIPEIIQELLDNHGLTHEAVDHLVLHQANARILKAVADRLSLPPEKVLSNLHLFGNTSAASIPLVLDEAARAGRLHSNDLVAMAGFGAGLSWGGALIRL